MRRLRRGGPWAAVAAVALASIMLVTSLTAYAVSTDIIANGASNISSRGTFTANCLQASTWWTNAHDHNDGTSTAACDATGVNSNYTITFTSGPVAARYFRLKATLGGTTTFTNYLLTVSIGNTCIWSTRTGQGCTTNDGGGWGTGAHDTGVVDLGSMISTSSPLTAQLSIATVGADGTITVAIASYELWDSDPAITGDFPAPQFNAVYVCKYNVDPCDLTTNAAGSGWSPERTTALITAELADTGTEGPCDLRLSELDGAGYVDLGELEYGIVTTNEIDSLSTGPLHAGPYLLTCTMPDSTGRRTTWPLTLRYTGEVDGSSNSHHISVVPPGATYNPVRDIGDGTPLAAIFDAWDGLVNAYRVRAPFVFFQPAADFITNTNTNINAAKMTPAPGRYGPTTCPGYTIAMPTPPVVHYTSAYGAAASAQPWPSAQPLPSFTILRCADFETIVSGWSWWHQARGLLDVGLYVGYGIFWLKRFQPRPSVNA